MHRLALPVIALLVTALTGPVAAQTPAWAQCRDYDPENAAAHFWKCLGPQRVLDCVTLRKAYEAKLRDAYAGLPENYVSLKCSEIAAFVQQAPAVETPPPPVVAKVDPVVVAPPVVTPEPEKPEQRSRRGGIPGWMIVAAGCVVLVGIFSSRFRRGRTAPRFAGFQGWTVYVMWLRRQLEDLWNDVRGRASGARQSQNAGPDDGAAGNQQRQEGRARQDVDPFVEACRKLGLPEDGNFTKAEFKKRFAAMMSRAHSDHGGSDWFAKAVLGARDIINSRKGWK